MKIFLTERAYSLIAKHRRSSASLIVDALNATTGEHFRIEKAPQNRERPGQVVTMNFLDDGEVRLKHLAATYSTYYPLTLSDYVSNKIIEYYGGEK